MHISFLGTISGSSLYAALKLNHTIEVPDWKSPTLEEICLGHRFDYPKISLVKTPDAVVTSSFATKPVMDFVKENKPQYVIWDLGPKLPTRPQINRVSTPLQLAGYEVALLKELSSHYLGFNYSESRAIIVAKKSDSPMVVVPAKIHITRPFTPLSAILDVSEDEVIIPRVCDSRLFHLETRPWSFVSPSLGDSFLKSHPLSLKVGAVWYGFNGKLHRLTPSEAAQIVGMPMECEKKLRKLIDEPGLAVYCILKDISFPLWCDIFERVLL